MKYIVGQSLRIPMGTQRRTITATCEQNETRYYRFDITCIRPAHVWYSEAQLAKLNPMPGWGAFLAVLAQFAATQKTDVLDSYHVTETPRADWRTDLYYSMIRI